MNCNACAITRPLNHCSDSISIGTFEPDTDYFIYLKLISTGSITRFKATSDNTGILIITTTDIEFATSSEYELWVTLASATNQHENALFDLSNGTIIIEDISCLLLKFEKVVDKDNCCVCLSEQVILLQSEAVQPVTPCVCVTQEMLDGFVESVTGDLVNNTDPQNPIINNPSPPSPNYKSYVANLQQTGTNAPTAIVLNSGDANFLGTLVWTYNSAGNYTGTLVGAFPDASKVWIASLSMNGNITVIGRVPRITYGDADSIRLEAFSIAANLQNQSLPQDGTLGSANTYTSIEIRVYI